MLRTSDGSNGRCWHLLYLWEPPKDDNVLDSFFFFFFLMLSRNFPLIDRFLWSKWGPNSSESWMVLAVFGFLFLRSFMTATLCKLFHRSCQFCYHVHVVMSHDQFDSCVCREVSWSIWFLYMLWGFVIDSILCFIDRLSNNGGNLFPIEPRYLICFCGSLG